MNNLGKVFIAGHTGLVGSALVRRISAADASEIVTRTRAQLDLTDASEVCRFFAEERPDVVFLAAARVGGIQANLSYPAEFIRENLLIQVNIIDAAFRNGCRKLIFLGSSCIYPRLTEQPIKETALLTGPLEPTNQAYAVAKIAGIEMCRAYRTQFGFDAVTVMPTNLYGPCDSFDSFSGHVIPSLMGRFFDAMRNGADHVVVWGSGEPRREFLYVDDLAEALLCIAHRYSDSQPVNIGAGHDLTIAELANLIGRVVGFPGQIIFDRSQPDGTPRKLLDSSRVNGLGWFPKVGLEEGLLRTWRWYQSKK